MPSHDDRELEAALRSALDDEAASITPTDRFAEIQARSRVAYVEPAPRRGRWLFSLAAAAAVGALVVAGITQWRPNDSSPPAATSQSSTPSSTQGTTASTPSETVATATDPAPSDPTTPATRALAAYYLSHPSGSETAADPQDWTLYRTFIHSTEEAGSAQAVLEALQWALSPAARRLAVDTDTWAGVEVTGVSITDAVVTVTLTGGGERLDGEDAAMRSRLSVQQLVWTTQAALGRRVPVTFTLADGGSRLFDTLQANGRYDRPTTANLFSEVARIWVDAPGVGEVAPADAPIKISGLAAVDNDALTWRIEVGGAAVREGDLAAQGDPGPGVAPEHRSFTVEAEALPAGDYVLVVEGSASGAAQVARIPFATG